MTPYRNKKKCTNCTLPLCIQIITLRLGTKKIKKFLYEGSSWGKAVDCTHCEVVGSKHDRYSAFSLFFLSLSISSLPMNKSLKEVQRN